MNNDKKDAFNLKDISKDSNVHFIALGGIGMSALARILMQADFSISGSDINNNHLMEYFKANGSDVYVGHSAENLKNCSVVVKSTAIRENNPEYKKALELGIPVIHRAEMLNALMTGLGQKQIGVTGTHGKTTTTGMIATIFYESGMAPSYAIGGEIPQLKTNSAYGKGDYFISELDESDGTVALYSPEVAVITNLELEHTDHYQDGFEQLLDTLNTFIGNMSSDGTVVINSDDSGNIELMNRLKDDKFVTYAIDDKNADYTAEIIDIVPDAKFRVYKAGNLLGEVQIGIPGEFNISNALGAIAASIECGVEFEKIVPAMATFKGMKKRFQTLGYANGARVIDDYAHHPTEVKATIDTAQNIVKYVGKGRVIGVFQPHRYTRFQHSWDDFLKSFDGADILYVTDVFAASEDPIDGVTSENFSKQLGIKDVRYVAGDLENVADAIVKEMAEGDMVLTMGAGTITKLGGIVLDKAK